MLFCSNDPVQNWEKLYWENPPVYHKKSNIILTIFKGLNDLETPLRETTEARILLWRCALHLNKQQIADSLKPFILNANPHLYPILKKNFELEDEILRAEIIRLLSEKHNPEMIPFFLKVLKEDQYYNVQKEAALALGALQAEKALPILKERLKSSESLVRLYAIQALTYYQREELVDQFLNIILDTGEEEDLRYQAARNIKHLWQKPPLHKLKKLFQSTKDSLTRMFLALIISNQEKSPELYQLATNHLEGENQFYQGLAIEILGNLKQAKAIPLLQRKLKYGNRHIRVKVLEALSRIGTPSAMKIIESALQDPNPYVSQKASQILQNRS